MDHLRFFERLGIFPPPPELFLPAPSTPPLCAFFFFLRFISGLLIAVVFYLLRSLLFFFPPMLAGWAWEVGCCLFGRRNYIFLFLESHTELGTIGKDPADGCFEPGLSSTFCLCNFPLFGLAHWASPKLPNLNSRQKAHRFPFHRFDVFFLLDPRRSGISSLWRYAVPDLRIVAYPGASSPFNNSSAFCPS